jgi:transposase InsO family protein
MAFLGHEIDQSGYHPSISKCEIIRDIPTPRTLREVRRFVGMASFFRKFIKNFAMIVEPLVRLTRKETPFKWTEEEESAFAEIKVLLMSKPILAFPDYEKPFHIFTDASNVGQGGALMQKDEENRYMAVAYFSRTLSSTERRWAAVHVELGAIITALREFKPFIFMTEVELHCDHKPLTYLMRNAKSHPSLARWLIELNNFHISIVHICGKQNTLADALSRLDEEKTEEEIKNVKELEDIAEFPVCLTITARTHVVNGCEVGNLMTLRTQEGDTLAIRIDEEQKNDEQAYAFIQFLIDGTMPDHLTDKEKGDFLEASKNLTVESGILYHHPEGARRRFFVPVNLRSLVFDSFHISPLGGGHMSIKKTAAKCNRTYYWPRMHRDLVFWTKCCITCQLRGKPTPRYRAEMLSTPVNTLFAKVGLDLCGPFPVTENGNKHILNVICWFTKYIISIPVEDARAVTLAHALLTKVYLVYGGCTELVSDNATSFTAEFFREFCSMLYINKHFATPHWSQGNAATERTFRTYQDILAKYIGKSDRNFDEFLPFATFCYNTATHSTTNESPFFLMFGRDPIFCVDQIIDPSKRPPVAFTEEGEFKRRLVTSLKLAWEAADEATKKAQEKSKEQYEKRRRDIPIQVGDRVLFRDYRHKTGEARKFHSAYRGIYRVVEIDGVHVTIVSCNSPQSNPLTVNINQLKPCYEWIPLGFTRDRLDPEEREVLDKAKATEVVGKAGYSHEKPKAVPLHADLPAESRQVYKNLRGRQVPRIEVTEPSYSSEC